MKYFSGLTPLVLAAALSAVNALADSTCSLAEIQSDQESVKRGFKAPGYSPYAGRNFPNKVLWGDTHLHTDNSLDARAFGVTVSPEEAYRLARGEEILSLHRRHSRSRPGHRRGRDSSRLRFPGRECSL